MSSGRGFGFSLSADLLAERAARRKTVAGGSGTGSSRSSSPSRTASSLFIPTNPPESNDQNQQPTTTPPPPLTDPSGSADSSTSASSVSSATPSIIRNWSTVLSPIQLISVDSSTREVSVDPKVKAILFQLFSLPLQLSILQVELLLNDEGFIQFC